MTTLTLIIGILATGQGGGPAYPYGRIARNLSHVDSVWHYSGAIFYKRNPLSAPGVLAGAVTLPLGGATSPASPDVDIAQNGAFAACWTAYNPPVNDRQVYLCYNGAAPIVVGDSPSGLARVTMTRNGRYIAVAWTPTGSDYWGVKLSGEVRVRTYEVVGGAPVVRQTFTITMPTDPLSGLGLLCNFGDIASDNGYFVVIYAATRPDTTSPASGVFVRGYNWPGTARFGPTEVVPLTDFARYSCPAIDCYAGSTGLGGFVTAVNTGTGPIFTARYNASGTLQAGPLEHSASMTNMYNFAVACRYANTGVYYVAREWHSGVAPSIDLDKVVSNAIFYKHRVLENTYGTGFFDPEIVVQGDGYCIGVIMDYDDTSGAIFQQFFHD